jgi:predicted MFS family arabinose efflux permease
VALPGTLTEAFAWMTTAVAVGSAIGAAVAGALVDSAGPGAVFGLAGVAGALAMVIAAIGLSGRGDEFALQTQS